MLSYIVPMECAPLPDAHASGERQGDMGQVLLFLLAEGHNTP